MESNWELEIAHLLNDLLNVQNSLLALLAKKRELLIAGDAVGLAAMVPEEENLAQKLMDSVREREKLLRRAGEEGLPSASLQSLAQSLPHAQRTRLNPTVREAAARARLLQHQSLTHLVVVQRTLLHLSQMLEIIATGGRIRPTYGGGEPVEQHGALVDRAA